MSNGESWATRIAKEGITAFFIEGIKWIITWLSPLVLAAMTVVAAYLQGVPWAYIIPLATFTFATTAVGLLRFDEWRFRRTPRDKLDFKTVWLGLNYVRDQNGKPISLSQAQIGIRLQSSANFQISYIVEDLRTSIDKRVNPKPTYSTRNAIVGLVGGTLYRDDQIDLQNTPIKPVLEGTAEFKIRYGRKGSERYLIAKKVNISCPFDPIANAYSTVTWVDAP